MKTKTEELQGYVKEAADEMFAMIHTMEAELNEPNTATYALQGCNLRNRLSLAWRIITQRNMTVRITADSSHQLY
jgi:hypothetical protein